MGYTYKECLVVVLLIYVLHISTGKESVKWIVNTKAVKFGESVSLSCIVPDNTCPENYVRRWTGGPSKSLLALNNMSTNTHKYQMYSIYNSSSFGLIINSINENDIECKYTCFCGFEQFGKIMRLRNSEYEFIYPIENWTMIHTAVLQNRQLNLDVSIEKVYPSPKCRLKLNDIVTVPNMTFTENYAVGQLLPRVTYIENITVNVSVCSALLIVECWNPSDARFFSVIQMKLKITEHCNISDSFHSWTTIAVIVVCCTISFVLVTYFIWQFLGAKRLLQKGITMVKERRTLLRNDEMLEIVTA